jgi:hypothetical protein
VWRKIAVACLTGAVVGATVAAAPSLAVTPKSADQYVISSKTLPAVAINPYGSGTVTLRWVRSTSPEFAAQRARGVQLADTVLIVSGGTLKPVPARPASASGCTPYFSSYSTCISVTGTAGTVNYWDTDAYYTGVNNTCAPQWLTNGALWEEHIWGCGYGPGRYADNSIQVPHTFTSKTTACNKWIGSYNEYKPCVTITP